MANQDTVIPGPENTYSRTFDGFEGPNFIGENGEDVVFKGNDWTTGFAGIYTHIDGSLNRLINRSSPKPDPRANFFGYYSYYDGNVVWDVSPLLGDYSGIWAIIDGEIKKIIDNRDSLDGKEIQRALLSLVTSFESFSGNHVAFRARFADGSQGVYVANLGGVNGSLDPPNTVEGTLITNCDWIRIQAPFIFEGCIPIDRNEPWIVTRCEGGCRRVAVLQSGSPTILSQPIDTGDTAGLLTFDYRFLTGAGELKVILGETELLSISAPATPVPVFSEASVPIDGDFLNRTDVILSFVMNGPTGSSVLIDNVTFPGLQNGDFQSGDLAGWIGTRSADGVVSVGVLTTSDLDNDGDTDSEDYDQLLATYGLCRGQNGFNVGADYNDDGCVTCDDYQTWSQFYESSGASIPGVSTQCPGTSLALKANQWQMIGLPYDVGQANTVQNLFGDDLNPATYGSRWVLYKWDANNQQYNALTLNSPLAEGEGYWLKTLDSGQSIDVTGTANPVPLDIDLVTDATAGRKNMVGYPYDMTGCWADAQVVDGESVLSLAGADPAGTCWTTPDTDNCVLSRLMHVWNGNTYLSYNGTTPGAEGTLNAFDGLWVKAFKSGIKLRLANTCAASKAAATPNTAAMSLNAARPAAAPRAEWWLRLTVASGDRQDPGNLLGRLGDSRNGFDGNDLPELAPMSPYLTLVFPHPDWGAQAGDYSTDYRRAGKLFQGGIWDFEVRSDVARTVTLVGAGSAEALSRSKLLNRETGRWLRSDAEGRYTVKMVGPVHRLRWRVK